MPKYYISSGTLQIIHSTKKDPVSACCDMLDELNDDDTLHEYFYVDERGFRNYTTAQPDTIVIDTDTVMEIAGWDVDQYIGWLVVSPCPARVYGDAGRAAET